MQRSVVATPVVRTQVRGGGLATNHSQAVATPAAPALPAGGLTTNHSQAVARIA
ncbi:hypothetical protein [Dactylosporangium sp. NPDC050588]|uniref:hypothetical protein n=1 Tax=Dactylosporangium sp. NPDC050588 TaxID=3157211 RepID=UPI0033CBF556